MASRLHQVDAFDRGGPILSAELAYVYNVDQREYRGNRISFAEPIASAEADQRSIIEPYPVGKQVKVFYSPQNPQLAVLELDILKYQLFFDFFRRPVCPDRNRALMEHGKGAPSAPIFPGPGVRRALRLGSSSHTLFRF